MTSPDTVFYSFDKPLTPIAEKTLDAIMKRFTDGEGNPLVKFETESLVTLRIPQTGIKKVFASESLSKEA